MHKLTVQFKVPYISTVSGIMAAVNGIEAVKSKKLKVRALQDIMKGILD
jgi:hypothetical protein